MAGPLSESGPPSPGRACGGGGLGRGGRHYSFPPSSMRRTSRILHRVGRGQDDPRLILKTEYPNCRLVCMLDLASHRASQPAATPGEEGACAYATSRPATLSQSQSRSSPAPLSLVPTWSGLDLEMPHALCDGLATWSKERWQQEKWWRQKDYLAEELALAWHRSRGRIKDGHAELLGKGSRAILGRRPGKAAQAQGDPGQRREGGERRRGGGSLPICWSSRNA